MCYLCSMNTEDIRIYKDIFTDALKAFPICMTPDQNTVNDCFDCNEHVREIYIDARIYERNLQNKKS